MEFKESSELIQLFRGRIELIKGEVVTRKLGGCIEIALIVLIPLVEINKRHASIRTSQTASKIFIMQFLKFPWFYANLAFHCPTQNLLGTRTAAQCTLQDLLSRGSIIVHSKRNCKKQKPSKSPSNPFQIVPRPKSLRTFND